MLTSEGVSCGNMVRNRKSLARLIQIAKGESGDPVAEDESESETTREEEN